MHVNDGEGAYVYDQLLVRTSLASLAVFWHVWEEVNKCIYIQHNIFSYFMLSGANSVCIICADSYYIHAAVSVEKCETGILGQWVNSLCSSYLFVLPPKVPVLNRMLTVQSEVPYQ